MKRTKLLFAIILVVVQLNLQAQNSSKAVTSQPPKVKISIAGLSSGSITVASLTANPKLVSNDSNLTIHSFELYMTRKDKDPVTYKSGDATLTEDMITGIKTQLPGDKVIFEKIMLIDKAGKEISVPDLAFKIK
jgi:hypothetical protein